MKYGFFIMIRIFEKKPLAKVAWMVIFHYWMTKDRFKMIFALKQKIRTHLWDLLSMEG